MKTIITLGLMFCLNVQASILNIDTSRGYNINGVPVGQTAVANGKTLQLLSTGTATKKMGIAKVKLFVLQTYAEQSQNFVRTDNGAASSIANVGTTAIRMTFLRSLDSATVQDAISTYLSNAISVTEMPQYRSDVTAIVSAINSQDAMYADDNITIVANGNSVQYENSAGRVFPINSNNQGLTTKIFSMFLGTVTDSDGASLKAQLLQNPATTFGY
jgi:hypothetical protein